MTLKTQLQVLKNVQNILKKYGPSKISITIQTLRTESN